MLSIRSEPSRIWLGVMFAAWTLLWSSSSPQSQHLFGVADAFVLQPPMRNRAAAAATRLFVFDFFKQRSQEGLQQLSNLAEATSQGKLGQGLKEAAAYTTQTNRAFAQGLAKSRNRLLSNLDSFFGTSWSLNSANSQEELLAELEDLLLMADLGTATAQDIIDEVKELVFQQQEDDSTSRAISFERDDLMSIMRGRLIETLTIDDSHHNQHHAIRINSSAKTTTANLDKAEPSTASHIPIVWFIMGANGMGKTTTIGKLAHRLRTEGSNMENAVDAVAASSMADSDSDSLEANNDEESTPPVPSTKVLVAACDTFRAGAVDQLQAWADRANVDMVGPTDKAKSPAAVLYNALDKAVRERYDILLVDTSGRLSSNDALTEELKKMKRVIQKRLSLENDEQGTPILNPFVPHETLLVLDAAQGRMALDSAKVWNQEIGLTGLIVTKLDGSARGGSVVAISRDLNLPVKLIGVGEGIEDLRDFEPDRFVDSLLGIGQFGGSGTKKNEGDLLAARLADLRQQRDSRAKLQVERAPVGAAPSFGDRAAAAIPDAMAPTGPPLRPTNPNRRKSNKKKKGKR